MLGRRKKPIIKLPQRNPALHLHDRALSFMHNSASSLVGDLYPTLFVSVICTKRRSQPSSAKLGFDFFSSLLNSQLFLSSSSTARVLSHTLQFPSYLLRSLSGVSSRTGSPTLFRYHECKLLRHASLQQQMTRFKAALAASAFQLSTSRNAIHASRHLYPCTILNLGSIKILQTVRSCIEIVSTEGHCRRSTHNTVGLPCSSIFSRKVHALPSMI